MGFLYKPFIGIALNGGILYLMTLIVDDIVYTGGFKFFIIGGIVLGMINFFVKPFIRSLSLPFVFLTGGLFLVVINIGILWFLSYFLDVIEFRDVSLTFSTWFSYVIGAIVFGVINWTAHIIIRLI